MIYAVECSFIDPASEPEWNEFYSLEKLPALISVSGFRTSQRFKAASAGCPTYLALHTVDGLAVLAGEEYRSKGGGNFARWQAHIADWHRNLYAGLDRAPAVAADEALLVSAVGAEPLVAMGLVPYRIEAVALDRSPACRWLAVHSVGEAAPAGVLPAGVDRYTPMTAQLTCGPGGRQGAAG